MRKTTPWILAAGLMLTLAPTLSAYEYKLENVMVSSYSIGGSGQSELAPAPGRYTLEYRDDSRKRLRGALSRDGKLLARDLPLVVSKCRDGRAVRPTGEFRRPRRGRKTVKLHLRASMPLPGGDSGKPRVCDVVIDVLLAAVVPPPQQGPPGTKPGLPPD